MRRALIRTAGATGRQLVAVALVAALAVAAAYSKVADPGTTLTSSRSGAFTIKGHVVGLYPGRTATLKLTIRNKNGFPIRVKSVRVKVGNAPGCPRSNLVVKRFRGSLRVRAKKTRLLRLPITMRSTAPDACMGDRFKLRYVGKAVKA
jgi:hypothetical protein